MISADNKFRFSYSTHVIATLWCAGDMAATGGEYYQFDLFANETVQIIHFSAKQIQKSLPAEIPLRAKTRNNIVRAQPLTRKCVSVRSYLYKFSHDSTDKR